MKQMLLPGICGSQTEEDPEGYIFVRYVTLKNGKRIYPKTKTVLRIPRSRLHRAVH